MKRYPLKLRYRLAEEADLPDLVAMLADDELGVQREDASVPLNSDYIKAFNHIDSDPNNELIVVTSDRDLVGMLQLTFIPYLTYTGSWRCLIEGVRIHSKFRGQGVGKQVLCWAIGRARERDCYLVQLTSDKNRPDAIRFYESLNFTASHEGLKLYLKR